MRFLFRSFAAFARRLLPQRRQGDLGHEARAPRTPETLEQRYVLVDEDAVADQVFERLRRRVFQLLDQNPRETSVLRETGRIAPGRPYFYLKPASGIGFLFERTGSGWVVAPAEKIVARDLFLRQGAPRERATLYASRDAGASGAAPRVRSPLFGDALTPFAVYEQKLLERLGL